MIEDILTKDEGKVLEFKESAQSLPDIIKTVIAFANTASGLIVIGVQDRTKKIVGVPNTLDEEERLINAISDSIAPILVPNVEIQTYRKKELILIHVPHIAGPYYLKSAGPERGVFFGSALQTELPIVKCLSLFVYLQKKYHFDEIPYAQRHNKYIGLGCCRKNIPA